MRRYSLAEIDDMRNNIAWLRKNDDPAAHRLDRWKAESVEDELRTLMAAGIEPGELEQERQRRGERIKLKRQWEDAEAEMRQRLCPHHDWVSSCFMWGQWVASRLCDQRDAGHQRCITQRHCLECGMRDRRRREPGGGEEAREAAPSRRRLTGKRRA